MKSEGYLSEIFFSIQGEGLHVGRNQVFVRTSGCREKCPYCDTLYSKARAKECRVYSLDERILSNPVSVEAVVAGVEEVAKAFAPVGTVSITGGEPLEQPDFVVPIAEELKGKGFDIHLDTNGIHVEAMRRAAPFVDVVAMDFKPPSAAGRDYWREHEQFLAAAASNEVFVKLVVASATGRQEIKRVAEIIASVDSGIPLVLQPDSYYISRSRLDREAITRHVMELQREAMAKLCDVRVIPQCHRLLGVR